MGPRVGGTLKQPQSPCPSPLALAPSSGDVPKREAMEASMLSFVGFKSREAWAALIHRCVCRQGQHGGAHGTLERRMDGLPFNRCPGLLRPSSCTVLSSEHGCLAPGAPGLLTPFLKVARPTQEEASRVLHTGFGKWFRRVAKWVVNFKCNGALSCTKVTPPPSPPHSTPRSEKPCVAAINEGSSFQTDFWANLGFFRDVLGGGGKAKELQKVSTLTSA